MKRMIVLVFTMALGIAQAQDRPVPLPDDGAEKRKQPPVIVTPDGVPLVPDGKGGYRAAPGEVIVVDPATGKVVLPK